MMDERSRTVWVGNVSDRVTEDLLYELFLQAGPLEKVKIATDKEGRSRRFAFVTFKHMCSVPYVIELMTGTPLYGYNLRIQSRTEGPDSRGQSSPAALPRSQTWHGQSSSHIDQNDRNPSNHNNRDNHRSYGDRSVERHSSQGQRSPEQVERHDNRSPEGPRRRDERSSSSRNSREDAVPVSPILSPPVMNPFQNLGSNLPDMMPHPALSAPLSERRNRILQQQNFAIQREMQRQSDRSQNPYGSHGRPWQQNSSSSPHQNQYHPYHNQHSRHGHRRH